MANIIPAASAELENAGDTGNWSAWFSSTVAQSTVEANNGTGSLAITATDPFAAVQLDNFPGWAAAPGDYAISWSMKGPAGATPTLAFEWKDGGGATLQTDNLQLTTTGAWVTESAQVTAPAGTSSLWATIQFDGSGTTSAVYYADSFVADDEPGGGGISAPYGRVAETDTTRLFAATKATDLGPATEQETVRGLTAAKSTAVGRVTEVEQIRGFAATKTATVGRVVEVEAARAFGTLFDILYGHVAETETVRAFTATDDGVPTAMIVGSLDGPARRVETVAGPALRREITGPAVRRSISGPQLAMIGVDGPSRHVDILDGPHLSRLITGPDVAHTITGSGV